MSKLVWDEIGKRTYETGVNQVALFVQNTDGTYKTGVAWSGITSIAESPSGADTTKLYADNIKYLNLVATEDFGATIEGYDSPDEFDSCDGTAEIAPGILIGQQTRTSFGLVYKTLIGNDTASTDYGYKLHIVYGCQAAPSSKTYSTVSDSPEANTLSWEVSTTPVNVTGYKPTATVVIDSTTVDTDKLAALEAKLYGDDENEPTLLLPDDIIAMFKDSAEVVAG